VSTLLEPLHGSGQRGECRRGGVQSREESGRAGGVIRGVCVMVWSVKRDGGAT
jgi:hypothetical protein